MIIHFLELNREILRLAQILKFKPLGNAKAILSTPIVV